MLADSFMSCLLYFFSLYVTFVAVSCFCLFVCCTCDSLCVCFNLIKKKKIKFKLKETKPLSFSASDPLQMSDSRVSSVIQEWATSYPGQVHTLNPGTPSNQLAQMDMIPYGQSQGLVRGGNDDRVAEQMMGLSYLPYTSSCLSNTSGAGNTNHHQSHGNTQQVCEKYFSFVLSQYYTDDGPQG